MLLQLDRVTKRYRRPGGEKVALDAVSLGVERGEMVGIFGPSGGGKTTLLRIAAGLQRPDDGSVIYDGEHVESMSSAERTRFRRREVACIWSDAAAPDGLSVLDYVELPLLVDHRDRHIAERRARQALLACEIGHCAGAGLHELSDGERQRAAIARALASEPRLLLADTPASRLALIEEERLMALLASLARDAKVAVLITDSNADALIRCSRALYLNDGKLLDSAPAAGVGRVYPFPTPTSRSAADA